MRWLVPASFVFALAIRTIGLGGSSMWLDEIMESEMARGSLRELFSALLFDRAQPPIGPLFTWMLLALDQGELARRFVHAIVGAAAVAVFARWVARRFDVTTAAVAGLFISASPVFVRYSHELRPYALSLLFSVWALDASERWLGRGAKRFPIELTVAVALASMTHYLAVAVCLPVAAAWIEARVEGRAAPLSWRIVAAVPVALLPVTCWFALLARSGGPMQALAPAVWNWESIERRFEQLLFQGYPGQETVENAALLFALLAATGFLVMARRQGGLTLFAGVFAGTVLVEVVLVVSHRFSHFRYNQMGLLFLLTAMAIGIVAGARIVGQWHRLAGKATAVLLAGAVFATQMNGVVGYAQRGRPDWPAVARAVIKIDGGRPHLLATNDWSRISLDYYLEPLAAQLGGAASITTLLPNRNLLEEEVSTGPGRCLLVLEAGLPKDRHLLDGLKPKRPVLYLPDTDGARLYRFAVGGAARQSCLPSPEFSVPASPGYGELFPWLARRIAGDGS